MFVKRTMFSLVLVLCLTAAARESRWGFFGHKLINRLAVFSLPPGMLPFYKRHLDYISSQAVSPDKRRYAVPGEAARHYLDLDAYGAYPFDTLPRRYEDALAKFGADSIQKHGVLPWAILAELAVLEDAFFRRDGPGILKASAELGHYLADAHVPLHTTRNYDGQFTGQRGVHGLWESRLPELHVSTYNLYVGRAEYVERPSELIWRILLESNAAVDSVLSTDRTVAESLGDDTKYTFEARGSTTQRTYSKAYVTNYQKKLKGMVARRLRESAYHLGCLWYTAWVNAGQPPLYELDVPLEMLPEEYQRLFIPSGLGGHGCGDD